MSVEALCQREGVGALTVESATTAMRYDICLSFAAEQRHYVEQVATVLRDIGFRVFYDSFETHELWGKDLIEHLDLIYRERSDHCVMFISADYARKAWPNHERRSAQARALFGGGDYLLPVRCDDTEIPGLPKTIGFLDARRITPEGLAIQLVRKLGRPAPAAASGQSGAQQSGAREPGPGLDTAGEAVRRHESTGGYYIGGDYVAGNKSGGDTIVSGGKHVYGHRDGSPEE